MLSDNHTETDHASIKIIAGKDRTMTYLYGPIDMESSPAVRERLLAVLQVPNSKKVSVDLSAVTRFDSSAVASLIEALKVARSHNIELTLQGLHGRLLRLFEVTGIASLFEAGVPR